MAVLPRRLGGDTIAPAHPVKSPSHSVLSRRLPIPLLGNHHARLPPRLPDHPPCPVAPSQRRPSPPSRARGQLASLALDKSGKRCWADPREWRR
ncbi:hypothetical protein NL676_030615 [Syzygium grande]|nr:hypothetical protein NL676_030615 [Syzygium grande]